LSLSRLLEWFGNAGVYWLNFWRLAFAYVLGKAWFLVSLAGFVPLLRAGMQHEAQGRVQLSDPSRVIRGTRNAYQPYCPEQLRRHLRKR
jgi:hypothetical protein